LRRFLPSFANPQQQLPEFVIGDRVTSFAGRVIVRFDRGDFARQTNRADLPTSPLKFDINASPEIARYFTFG